MGQPCEFQVTGPRALRRRPLPVERRRIVWQRHFETGLAERKHRRLLTDRARFQLVAQPTEAALLPLLLHPMMHVSYPATDAGSGARRRGVAARASTVRSLEAPRGTTAQHGAGKHVTLF